MSVKRVSDLPSIENFGDADSRQRFMKSFMEVSYLSSDVGAQTYASNKIKVSELLEAFRYGYYSQTPITGNISVNVQDGDALHGWENYAAAIYEGRVDI